MKKLVLFQIKALWQEKKKTLLFLLGIDMVNYFIAKDLGFMSVYAILLIPFILAGQLIGSAWNKGTLDALIVKTGRTRFLMASFISVSIYYLVYIASTMMLRYLNFLPDYNMNSEAIIIHINLILLLPYLVGLAFVLSFGGKGNEPAYLFVLINIAAFLFMISYGILLNVDKSPFFYVNMNNIFVIFLIPALWIFNETAMVYYGMLSIAGFILIYLGIQIFRKKQRI